MTNEDKSFNLRLHNALYLMKKNNMWESNYAPPLYKKLWKYGVQIPPPPFCPFWLNTLTFGFFFGMAWGGVMFVLTISISSFSNGVILYYSILAGLLFGLVMAAFHRWRKTVNRLPDWDDL